MPVKESRLRPSESSFSNILKDLFVGSAPRRVKSQPFTGNLNWFTKPRLMTQIDRIARETKAFALVATGDPALTVQEDRYRRPFNAYQVVCTSPSEAAIRNLHRELIARYRHTHAKTLTNADAKPPTALTSYDGKFHLIVVYR